jgi:serine protease AprX
MKRIFTLLAIVYTFQLSAQNKYIVYFTDKNDTPYSISNPSEFLTQRSIDRRQRQNIAITGTDLPVTPKYIDSVASYGAIVWYSSRWFNAVIIDTDESTFNSLLTLGFVSGGNKVKRIKKKIFENDTQFVNNSNKTAANNSLDYGSALEQAQQIGVDVAHNEGYKGEGIIIGVMDSGFRVADTLDVFDSLFVDNRVLGTYDFVAREESVFEDHNHGMSVLSTMAAYLPGQMIGTAPKASYYLFRTEDVGSEYWIEETNWLIAAERADSLGVDILNTSLGYSTFDDASYNYTYSQMNGNTTIITKAADLAAKVGMLPVVSAGNEGSSSWYYITAPADADSVIAVGAVSNTGSVAGFSSRGPSADGRVKPNVCARGLGAAVANTSNTISFSSGTSFSGPILCGMVACFWQANPTLTNMEVIHYIQKSGNNFNNPDNECGYGIPNYTRAKEALMSTKSIFESKTNYQVFFDNNQLLINMDKELIGKEINVLVSDLLGREIINQSFTVIDTKMLLISDSYFLTNGMYIVKIISENNLYSTKVLKN